MNENWILETPRLFLRRLEKSDAENLYLLNLDPEVIQYTGDISFKNILDAQLFLANYDHYEKYDFGRWAVVEKSSSEFIGWCGLKYTPNCDEYDIGFRFFKKYWNKGFATEAAETCIKLGFEKYQLQTIVGRARKENISSIRVLEKIGLTYIGDFDFNGNDGLLYIKNKF
jgi:RimJ/RimL family protein N-acetyltransferase